VAECWGSHVLAVVMTGMGKDGLLGSHAISAAGGSIMVQDEESSVVWGMPRVVSKAGLAEATLPLADLAAAVISRVKKQPQTVSR